MVDELGGTTGALDALADRIGRVIRATRTAQGLSLSELARGSGLSKTILGRIESGQGNPSIETLWRVARALHLPLGMLLAEDQEPRVQVIRREAGETLGARSGMQAWLVHADGREHRSEVFDLSFGAGVRQRSEAHMPGTEELVVCTAGRLNVGPVDEPVVLEAGDALWFAADVPHVYAGLTAARALCWLVYPGAGGGATTRARPSTPR